MFTQSVRLAPAARRLGLLAFAASAIAGSGCSTGRQAAEVRLRADSEKGLAESRAASAETREHFLKCTASFTGQYATGAGSPTEIAETAVGDCSSDLDDYELAREGVHRFLRLVGNGPLPDADYLWAISRKEAAADRAELAATARQWSIKGVIDTRNAVAKAHPPADSVS